MSSVIHSAAPSAGAGERLGIGCPAQLSGAVRAVATGYQRLIAAAVTGGDLDDGEVAVALLAAVVRDRDDLHRRTYRFMRLADEDGVTFGDLDPEPVQEFALDFSWAATIGLIANLSDFAAAIDVFPSGSWDHWGRTRGRIVTAGALARGGVRRLTRHLVEAEQMLWRPEREAGASVVLVEIEETRPGGPRPGKALTAPWSA